MKIYNTLNKTVEDFEPISGEVGIYNCGPTVYDCAHIGNLRAFLFADLLRRALEFAGYKVRQAMNITDVGHLISDADTGEDKIEKGAKRENKSASEIAKYYEEQFKTDIHELNIETPNIMPRATEHIAEQIGLIKVLEQKSYTYKISDGLYFDTSKLMDYGKLANLDIKGLRFGARVESNPEKKNATDFALWKFSYAGGRPFNSATDNPDQKRQMEWDSPWGIGFPGWHLECSAMSVKYLGQPFDIHTGGVDHIPVHHTNEIAQSEAAYDKPLANYWMHSEFLLVDGQKMSKSLGNYYTLKDIKDGGFSPLDFRYLCLQSHYRSKMNFTWEGLSAASNARARLKNICGEMSNDKFQITNKFQISNSKYLNQFKEKLFDDLNMPEALAVIWEMARDEKVSDEEKTAVLKEFDDKILALELFENSEDAPDEINKLLVKRSQAKAKKDYQKADQIREQIELAGYILEDGPDGTKIIKK